MTLKNTCGQTVVLFKGEDPKGDQGKHHSLGQRGLFSTAGRQGEKIWLVQPGDVTTGIDSFELDPAVSKMYIDETCTKFTQVTTE